MPESEVNEAAQVSGEKRDAPFFTTTTPNGAFAMPFITEQYSCGTVHAVRNAEPLAPV